MCIPGAKWREDVQSGVGPRGQDVPVLDRFPACPIPALSRETPQSTVQTPHFSPSPQRLIDPRWTPDPQLCLFVSGEASRENRGRGSQHHDELKSCDKATSQHHVTFVRGRDLWVRRGSFQQREKERNMEAVSISANFPAPSSRPCRTCSDLRLHGIR